MDLPEDPNLKDFTGSKPAFASGKCGTPRKSADSPRTSKVRLGMHQNDREHSGVSVSSARR